MDSGGDKKILLESLKALLCLDLFKYQQLVSIKSRNFGKFQIQ